VSAGDQTQVPREPTERLFFALWPGDAERGALAQATARAVRDCGGRPVAVSTLHATLAFLGSVPVRRIPEVRAAGQRAAMALAGPLTLTFERLDHWRKPQVLCAVSPAPAPPIAALAQRLQKLTLEAGFSPDLKPFRAHITVARKVKRPTQSRAMEPVCWAMCGFALLASRPQAAGPAYSIVESYLLYGGRQPAP
jgi:RNA 2',3'-cyclic 3'-phosphodiesterase